MWDCISCGCKRIAASLPGCPKCRKERDMATATTGGASNARALPGETGYVPPEEEAADAPVEAAETPAEPEPEPEAAAEPEPAEAVSEPEPEAVPEPEPEPALPLAPSRAGRREA
jgi:hypothetical protein